ncbi:MAG TPA: hypothetical protein VKR60_02105 [Candidatus Sulfotelmatobacter sp.]|nr:hypothetical protein [Candidatus Sulfotelmatobacter sp.]
MLRLVFFVLLGSIPLMGQATRLWVLRAPGEMAEYDPATFAAKQSVKVPQELLKLPASVSVNPLGQILFAPAVSLPLAEGDADGPHKAWVWNGKAATWIDLDVSRKASRAGSNVAITESAVAVYLSTDGQHLFWFAIQARRLQREEVDLSTATTWQAWQTDMEGNARQELASAALPDCHCATGSCEETCPYGVAWAPEDGVGRFFLMTQFIAGQTGPTYKATVRYQEEAGKWTAHPLALPLERVLDAASGGDVIVEAIPDTGCCGWLNQSDDQTLLHNQEKTLVLFDELATFKNPDYDVSFYTSNARVQPSLGAVAMTLVSTAETNKPIQLAEQGQASVDEAQRVRKAVEELPAVEVKSVDDSPKRLAYLPHATLVGWISDKEILVVEGHVLVAYNVGTGVRRKSAIRVEDAAHLFLR